MDCNIFDYHKTRSSRAKRFDPNILYNNIINLKYNSPYGGILNNGTNKELMKNWYNLNKSRLNNDLNLKIFDFKNEYSYFQGKLYYIDKNFAKFIKNKGSKLSRYFTNNLGGAEDFYIGLMFQIYTKKISLSQIEDFLRIK